MKSAWKVGELAKQTGLSVRTLHYYDEIGLLCPSQRTEAGYRLYTADDIVRLQQIKSLRQMGFSLEEIRDCLKGRNFSPQRVIHMHLERLKEQITLQQNLCQRLEAIASRLNGAQTVSVEEFMQTIEVITMVDNTVGKYYTPEQMEYLAERRRIVGEERIREVEAEWPVLMEEVRAEMDKGTDPTSETVQALARRWMGLVNEFTGGNAGIEQSLRNMYQQEPVVAGMETGPMQGMMDYISKAMESVKRSG